MAQRTSLLWPVTAAVSAVACLAFGVLFYPRGPDEEAKYAYAAKRKAALDMFSTGFEAHRAGRAEEATARYREAMAIDSTIGSGHYFLGTALFEAGKLDEAVKEFDQAIALEENRAHAYNSRGAARWRLGDAPGAARDFDASIAADPEFLAPHSNRGLLLLREGKPAKAVDEFDLVIAEFKSPHKGPAIYEGRGIARAMLGDTEGADADLTSAVEYGTGKERTLSALYNRARLREAKGDIAGAQADRAEYARLKDLPEKSERFARPLKGGDEEKKEGTASDGL
jgi:Tfp pilus assembly protein PilF